MIKCVSQPPVSEIYLLDLNVATQEGTCLLCQTCPYSKQSCKSSFGVAFSPKSLDQLSPCFDNVCFNFDPK